MKAMIFAAGMGTRLKPLTNDRPKALVEVGGHPMIKLLLLQLKLAGITEVIINVHHFALQLIAYIEQNQSFGMHIEISDESNQLLDTGGGLKKAAWFFNDGHPFLLHNVDILSNINLSHLLSSHLHSNALATLAVSKRSTSRYLIFDDHLQLTGWKNHLTGEKIIISERVRSQESFAFSGIHVINPALIPLITEEGSFSMIDVYLRLGKTNPINGYVHDPSGWIDMGKPADLEVAGQRLGSGMFNNLISIL